MNILTEIWLASWLNRALNWLTSLYGTSVMGQAVSALEQKTVEAASSSWIMRVFSAREPSLTGWETSFAVRVLYRLLWYLQAQVKGLYNLIERCIDHSLTLRAVGIFYGWLGQFWEASIVYRLFHWIDKELAADD